MTSYGSSTTIAGNGKPTNDSTSDSPIDLCSLPPIMVLAAHMSMEELHEIENRLLASNATLTYATSEAKVFLGKVEQKRRALLELRSRGILTEDAVTCASDFDRDSRDIAGQYNNNKRPLLGKRKRSGQGEAPTSTEPMESTDSSTESEEDQGTEGKGCSDCEKQTCTTETERSRIMLKEDLNDVHVEHRITILKAGWLSASVEAKTVLPLRDYVVYRGQLVTQSSKEVGALYLSRSAPGIAQVTENKAVTETIAASAKDILARAQADPVYRPYIPPPRKHNGEGLSSAPDPGVEKPSFASSSQLHGRTPHNPKRMAQLLHETTSEHESITHDLPDPPRWVVDGLEYSCQRVTPLNGPNDAFIDQLKKIRTARDLTNDQIGVRAYSTSIASIAAYPYTITSPREIVALPGCDFKIASLWAEWKNNDGHIDAVEDAENDERLKVLRLFYEIWGVGPHTAREFYERGWRELDDIVEFGWNELSRVQQIGVKFYDEFQMKIPRPEVERIAKKVHEHAQRVREPSGVRTCIVGGYRRGKLESGDVDVIVSHLDVDATLNIVTDIVASLVADGWITHELKTNLTSTKRGQAALPVKSTTIAGSGFDTLDKSMVVWQEQEEGVQKGVKNSNPHRRVDIIIAPWDKVGCAVLGWSGGTTFQRDVRRYVRKTRGWKFDSSGIRDRSTGEFMDLEAAGGRSTSCEEAERKVFAGIGLAWKEPWERCTG